MAIFKVPEFRPDPMASTEARIKALEGCVAALTRELGYVLSHLDDGNFADGGRERLIGLIKEAMGNGTSA